jgi:tetratricopeptide (TPR) repeat protein
MSKARRHAAPPAVAPSSAPAPTARATPSPGRRRLLLALTLALPWTLLALVEVGLRIGGVGGAYPLFVPYDPEPGWLLTNPDFARRYFADGPFTPTPHLDFLRATKAPGTFRVVFQGESSAAGYPYGHGGAPSRMLAQRLQATFPDRPIEVVNAAFTAISSYTLLDQVDDIVAQRPDAVMIYTGHNEYYGVLGAGSTRTVGGARPLVRAYLALRRLRTVQLLGRLVGPGADARVDARAAARDADADDAPRTVMQLLAGDRRIPLGSPLYERGLAQFRGNLAAMLARYRARGIPVFVGTVVSNERDQPPFVTGFAAGTDTTAWWSRYGEGTAALARGDTASAMRALADAVRMDDMAAAGHYALARLHEARGDSVAARAGYRAAKERDELRFRAPEAINAIIREEAARHGATLVETQRAVERASPGGVPGHTLVLEHLHPNLDGYFVIADAFYAALRARGLPAPWAGAVPAAQARREVPVTPVDSVAALLRTDRLTSGWPFQPRGATRVQMIDTLRPRTPAERLAQAHVRGEISWAEATDRLRLAAEGAGEPALAVQAALALAHEYPYTPQPYMDAARLALAQRRYAEGLRYARLAHARRETPNGAQLVGLLLLRLGDHAAAMPFLERAAQLAPGDERMVVPLRAASAIPALEDARTQVPADTSVLFELAVAYAYTQQYEKARATLTTLRGIAPAHAGARELAGQLPPDAPAAPPTR